MIAPAEFSRSWMFIPDDSVVYRSGAKFPRSIGVHRVSGVYRGRWDRVANWFVRCLARGRSIYCDHLGRVAVISVRSCSLDIS